MSLFQGKNFRILADELSLKFYLLGQNHLEITVDHLTLFDLIEAIRLTKMRMEGSSFNFDLLHRKRLETLKGEMLQFCGFHYYGSLYMVLYYYCKGHNPWKPLTLLEWRDNETALEEFVKKIVDSNPETEDMDDESITFEKCKVEIDPVKGLFTLYNKDVPEGNGITMPKDTIVKLSHAMEEASVASMNADTGYGLIFYKLIEETDQQILKLHCFHVAYTPYMVLLCDKSKQMINFTKWEDQKINQLINNYESSVAC